MAERTLVLVPGYNEPPAHFEIIQNGKNGLPGVRAFGFKCVTFGVEDDKLRDRIDRFADYLTELRREGFAFPAVTLGYSLGGLVVRGFLRAYPERAREVSHTVMVAAPNWGVVTMAMPHLTAMLRVPDKAMGDMDLHSEFMRWLNGVSGHWQPEHDKRNKIWMPEGEPFVAPEGSKILAIQGLIPKRGGDNDGLVWADSSTLGSRIPAHYIVGPHANHMNIIGHFDPVVMMTKGFLANDRVWPLTLRALLRFIDA